jgi:Uma2 family endonuclease
MVSCEMQTMATAMYDKPEIEYLDGRPYPKVSPKLSHGLVQIAVARAIGDCAGERGFVVSEVRFDPGAIANTKKTEFVPDVAYLSRERRQALSGKGREKPPLSPELAVEVRSPSDDLRYLARKMTRYLATGCVLALDVDPKTRRITAHSADGVREYTTGDQFEHPALPWLRFVIDAIFADLDPL